MRRREFIVGLREKQTASASVVEWTTHVVHFEAVECRLRRRQCRLPIIRCFQIRSILRVCHQAFNECPAGIRYLWARGGSRL
jgi:hypothetical protein